MPQRYFFILFLFCLTPLWSQKKQQGPLDEAMLNTASPTLEKAVQPQDTLAVKKDTLVQKKN